MEFLHGGTLFNFHNMTQWVGNQKKYLPYTSNNQSGLYKATVVADQSAYYSNSLTYNETSAYSNTTFDNSPLNRISNVKESGTKWAASNGNTSSHDMNTTVENVQIFGIVNTQGSPPTSLGTYPANTLYKLTYTDVNNNQVIEYTNKSGELILKKVQAVPTPSAAHIGWICTYYIYDNFGLLRFQVQPEGVKWLDANAWNFNTTPGLVVFGRAGFRIRLR